MFQSLDQIGLQRVLQKGGHGPGGLQVAGGDGLAVIGVAHDHARQARLQVGQAAGEAEHGHNLAGHGDVKAVLARHAVHAPAEAVRDEAQLAVVHVHGPPPGDAPRVDVQGVALIYMVVQHGSQQVVRRADGVEIAREVEVDVLHRYHLRIAAAGRAALDAEHRPQRRLAQRDHAVFAQPPQGVRQADRGGGLALARGRGVDGGHQYQLAVRRRGPVAQERELHLGLVAAVVLQILAADAGAPGDGVDGLGLRGLGDLNVCHAAPLKSVFCLYCTTSSPFVKPNCAKLRLDALACGLFYGERAETYKQKTRRALAPRVLFYAT